MLPGLCDGKLARFGRWGRGCWKIIGSRGGQCRFSAFLVPLLLLPLLSPCLDPMSASPSRALVPPVRSHTVLRSHSLKKRFESGKVERTKQLLLNPIKNTNLVLPSLSSPCSS